MTRVLVAEDELRLGGVIEETLSAAQYTVDLALDGEEALDFARTSTYDAIVLDVLLPRVDGLEICRRLRAAGSLTRSGDWFTVALPSDDDGVTVPDLVRDLVDLGVRVHAVEPVRISLEERLLGILRHEEPSSEEPRPEDSRHQEARR
jgi:CheY-like chemotaxis protein